MNDRSVSDIHVAPDSCRRLLIGTMNNRTVLHVASVTNPDRIHIATDHRIKPETTTRSRNHIAHQSRVFGYETIVSQFRDRKSTRLNSSHVKISYAVFCLKKKKNMRLC